MIFVYKKLIFTIVYNFTLIKKITIGSLAFNSIGVILQSVLPDSAVVEMVSKFTEAGLLFTFMMLVIWYLFRNNEKLTKKNEEKEKFNDLMNEKLIEAINKQSQTTDKLSDVVKALEVEIKLLKNKNS